MIKVAILGLGERGGEAYGLFAFNNPTKFVISAICDIDKSRLEKYKKKFMMEDERCFNSAEDFFACGKMADVLLVCANEDKRYYHAMQALEIGYHLLLEKPIADNLAKCVDIMNKAKELNRVVLVCNVCRYVNYFVAIKKLIDSGTIGKIIKIEHKETAKCHVKENCCDFDVISWLVGKKCEEIYCSKNSEDVENKQKILFKFENDIAVNLELTSFSGKNSKKTIIYGAQGIIEANNENNTIKIIDLRGAEKDKLINIDSGGSCAFIGGFDGIMEYLYNLLSNPITYDDWTDMIEESIYLHVLTFAAIESEKKCKPILIKELVKDLQK